MLQCVLTGKARKSFSGLSVADSKLYATVKSSVLKVFELVLAAYCQHFYYRKEFDGQPYSESVCDLTCAFNQWCKASEVATFEALCELVELEQFNDSVSEQVASYAHERKVLHLRQQLLQMCLHEHTRVILSRTGMRYLLN